MHKFAKLFDDEELGQLLVKADPCDEDEREEVRFYFDPCIEGVHLSSVAVSSTTKGFAYDLMDNMTYEKAVDFVRHAKQEMHKMLG